MPDPNMKQKLGQHHKANPGGELGQHYGSNPGELLGHDSADLAAVHGRESGEKAAPGPSGAPPLPPFNK